jgi:hypothetical protein
LKRQTAVTRNGITNVGVLNNGTNADIVTNITGNLLLAKATESSSYDLDGNLLSDSIWTNVWNAENRLVAVASASGVPTNAGGSKKKEKGSVKVSVNGIDRFFQRAA